MSLTYQLSPWQRICGDFRNRLPSLNPDYKLCTYEVGNKEQKDGETYFEKTLPSSYALWYNPGSCALITRTKSVEFDTYAL